MIPANLQFCAPNFFLTGTEIVKDVAKSVTASGVANVSKVRKIIESDGIYTICGITTAVGISLLRMHFI